jgi:hypothetical protein
MSKWLPLALIVIGLALTFGAGLMANSSNFGRSGTVGIFGLVAGILITVGGLILLIFVS